MGQEQEEEERQQLHRSWEMAAVLDFLDLFREDLKLDRAFIAHELESVLILSPGGEGLLGAVHIVGFLPCPSLYLVPVVTLAIFAPFFFWDFMDGQIALVFLPHFQSCSPTTRMQVYSVGIVKIQKAVTYRSQV